MKKILFMILIVGMSLSLLACPKKEEEAPAPEETTEQPADNAGAEKSAADKMIDAGADAAKDELKKAAGDKMPTGL